jgi:hypothetical protein
MMYATSDKLNASMNATQGGAVPAGETLKTPKGAAGKKPAGPLNSAKGKPEAGKEDDSKSGMNTTLAGGATISIGGTQV